MRSRAVGRGAREALFSIGGAALAVACGGGPAARPPQPVNARAAPPPSTTSSPLPDSVPAWPTALSTVLASRGDPHAQPIALPPDARGRSRWLVFSGPVDVAWGAWRVARAADGTTDVEPVDRWPVGVRVLGAVVEGGVAYVLLESVGVLDQPAGLRAAWIDTSGGPSPFESSPMALADVRDTTELASRVKHPPSREHDAAGLLATLRTASASTGSLSSVLAAEGADVRIAWQSLFTQRVGHFDGPAAASSPLASAMLAVVREALATQACGTDACEAWTETGRAVVRFGRQDSHWVIREVIEDAPVARAPPVGLPLHAVPAAADASETEAILRARAREVRQVLGQAPLATSGGTIGVGLTDLDPDAPVVALREGAAVRVFAIDADAVRGESGDARWDAAFADVNGDGRTDVVMKWSGTGVGGLPLSWSQAFIAPAPSVQASTLEADLASALVLIEAPDAGAAARAATSLPLRTVSHDDACRLLGAAATPAGFRRHASGDARVFHFDEPGMPTWRPKVVPLAKLANDDVRDVAMHCADLQCSATRPYCAWTGGADSAHFWFDWRDGQLEIVGAADYDGE